MSDGSTFDTQQTASESPDQANRQGRPSALTVLQAVGLAGPSAASASLAAAVDLAAKDAGSVLLVGEPGCGHLLVARAIHHLSETAARPFVIVACGGDPERLDRILFGETAADRSRTTADSLLGPERVTPEALAWRAKGGTLFLDALEELPERLQARLAHLLRDRVAILAGEERRCSLGFRAIAAGRLDIDHETEEGRLRPDLMHRFSGARISLPALRHRRDDIPAMAGQWVTTACRKAKIPPKKLDHAAQALLAALPWRGNVSELRAVTEALVAQVDGSTITIEDILATNPISDTVSAVQAAQRTRKTLREARREFERHYVAAVLAAHHGRIPDAAKTLGIQRTNLYRKLRTLRIQLNGYPNTDPSSMAGC